jgi:hypothetical protein
MIADVILAMKYTSLDGGLVLKTATTGSVAKFIKECRGSEPRRRPVCRL